ncbi:pre-mRNA-processing factor 17 [Hydra vulgaris]|uniref:pre-mRNA-processing factor 17 n=1 Tax=Hydra vulgaris TaxID=6087 RepID=UPI000641637E|nr:pre-mRNA-processing factor 17 [Hydra vulgaris]
MDGLSSYISDEEEPANCKVGSPKAESNKLENDSNQISIENLKTKYQLNIVPPVIDRKFEYDEKRYLVDSSTKELKLNIKYDDLFKPEIGPVHPYKTQQQLAKRNTLAGFVEKANVSDFQFDNQHKTFISYGYALDPSTEGETYVGAITKMVENGGKTVFESTKKRLGDKRKRLSPGNPEDIDGYKGPWAPFVDQKVSSKPNEEQQTILTEYEEKKEKKSKKDDEKIEEKSRAHIDDLYDYQGRSFLHIPVDVDVDLKKDEPPEKCFLPKKLIHTWSGHSKGVTAIRLFPKSGHLLLSSSMDCKIKIWEVYNKRRNIRTYIGHTKSVRDICFNNDGTKFISCGYDRWIKLWDTETGECLGRYSNKKIPYCIKFNPDEDKQHLFIAGMSDNKMITWDTRENEIVQEYDRHLGSVNTITFVDKNQRIVTTSDDKSLRIWEWDIPVDAKLIQEPSMHSMPAATLSPNGKWLATQSMDNQILIYSVLGRFRQNRKKIFKGHMNAGYACQVNFSPDMSYLVSGDADGKLNIWDWKTTKLYSKFKAHDQVCIGCEWLPHETSKIATCGWDGLIKLWD